MFLTISRSFILVLGSIYLKGIEHVGHHLHLYVPVFSRVSREAGYACARARVHTHADTDTRRHTRLTRLEVSVWTTSLLPGRPSRHRWPTCWRWRTDPRPSNCSFSPSSLFFPTNCLAGHLKNLNFRWSYEKISLASLLLCKPWERAESMHFILATVSGLLPESPRSFWKQMLVIWRSFLVPVWVTKACQPIMWSGIALPIFLSSMEVSNCCPATISKTARLIPE